ncbi:MAG: prolyl oligopeptidase family serine peptidase [Acetobacteraceae bacterium]|nr:prolyl oligopeptidase family serine peptidase [Acetobacteraceae bacterium]
MTRLACHRAGPARGGPPGCLVLLLHGYGADGADLIGLAEPWGRAVPGALFLAPDAPEPCDLAPWGRQWFPLSDMDPARLAEGVSRAVPAVQALAAEEAARHGIAPGRVALMGFSQGAMLALAAGLSADPPPACILAYAGALLAGLGAARPPVLLVHGEADTVVPAAASRAAASALQAAGVPVQALFRPALGHGIDEAGIAAGAAFLARHLR